MKNRNLFFIVLMAITLLFCTSAIYAQPEYKKGDIGVGPIKSLKLGAIDPKMVKDGKNIFANKCMICHELDSRKIGPPLGNIAEERSPEFIMNLLLNTSVMQTTDPYIKALIVKYNNIVMTDPGLSKEQSRSVLEYLRSVVKKK